MAIDKQQVADAKKSLKKLTTKPPKNLTMKDFVGDLIEDIHEKLELGHSLSDVCDQINEALPADQKMKMNTFKTYVQQVRAEKNIKSIRPYKKKAAAKPETTEEAPTSAPKKDRTESDFRDMSADL